MLFFEEEKITLFYKEGRRADPCKKVSGHVKN
jgi:hypothetical protein